MRKISKGFIIFIHALVVWALCGATIAVGRMLTSMEITLIIHAIGAPIFAFIVSLIYYKKFNFTSPFITALIFFLFAIGMDGGVVAPFIEKSYVMFSSFLGLWLPLSLIFLSTYLTGLVLKQKK